MPLFPLYPGETPEFFSTRPEKSHPSILAMSVLWYVRYLSSLLQRILLKMFLGLT
jgi:hypothetical protein